MSDLRIVYERLPESEDAVLTVTGDAADVGSITYQLILAYAPEQVPSINAAVDSGANEVIIDGDGNVQANQNDAFYSEDSIKVGLDA